MSEIKVPTVLAVAAWLGSGLCVLTYTYLAYKETSGGAHDKKAEEEGLVANHKISSAQLLSQLKPLERGKFKLQPNRLPKSN